ncbi:hypothetical protein H3S75_01265 [Gilliamella sp. B14384G15]|uniref:hypothetical protein n=1 Tax=unclassified Gilliamella TaxID=2685620 RepID=UPI0018DC4143|nr:MULTISPECIES: hypothetical protein [unclassified Gilliamella]MBI0029863.1 hypothetical protein [Gilliamella sp. B14384G15]MBI0057642.1 hypothetical protein [Gilliamella sp. B14384G12]
MTNQPKKIILDCDPSHHDTNAILLAQGNPNIELIAVKPFVRKVDRTLNINSDSELDVQVRPEASIQLGSKYSIDLILDSLERSCEVNVC